MRKRQWYTISSFLLLLGGTLVYAFITKTYQSDLERYSRKLERALHEEEYRFEKIFTDDQLLHQIVHHYDATSRTEIQPDLEQIEKLSEELFTLLVYKDNQLIYWSNNEAIPTDEQFAEIVQSPSMNFTRLNDTYFEVLQKTKFDVLGEYNFLGLIPIRRSYSRESTFLQDEFLYVSNFPENIHLSASFNANLVRSKDGVPLFSLVSEGKVQAPPRQQAILFTLIILSVLALLVLINEIANHFSRRFGPATGALFLLIAAGGLRFAAYQTSFFPAFESVRLVQQVSLISVLNGSLGDLLVNSLLGFWLVIFFLREFEVKPAFQLNRYIRFGIIAGSFSIIIFGILFLIRIFKSLVLESSVILDFDNILNFNIYSVLALVSILLVITSLFLFSHKMIQVTQNLDRSGVGKYVALALALLLTSPFVWFFDLKLPLLLVLSMISLYLITFDVFLKNKFPGFTWLVIWVAGFSAFSSTLLFKYNLDKDLTHRLAYAEKLAEPDDEATAGELFDIREQMTANDSLQHWLTEDRPEPIGLKEVRVQIDSILNLNPELYQQFTYDIAALDAGGTYAPIAGQTPEEILPLIEEGTVFTPTSFKGIYSYLRPTGDYVYNMHIPYLPGKEEGREAICYIVLEPRERKPSKVYSELLLSSADNNGEATYADYDYAVIGDNSSINISNDSDEHLAIIAGKLDKGEWENRITAQSADLVYKADNGKIVRVSKNIGGILKPLSLFSYIFVLIIFLILALNGLNFFFRTFPDTLGLELFGRPSLQNRIQTGVILLVIGSFLVIAIVTATFFRDSSIEYHENRLQRKISTVVEDLQHQINFAADLGATDIDYEALARATSDIHRMDINIFGLNGQLIATSAQNVYDIGLLSQRMNAKAYFSLYNYRSSEVLQDEQLGSLNYISSYLPIRVSDDEIVGYLNLPYYSQSIESRKDLYAFMGRMLNAYVFLFLLAGIIAILVAKSITKPISQIGEKLKYVKLGKNDPLEWKTHDELGELISLYNEMIHKLEDSTEKLKVSEREGAWREMAKQIAHEIKNPLTPMKLSIQYLNHAYKANPNDVQPLLNRVSKTLIEQIDGLSRIASEFSNFAKMPKAENQALSINELLTSVYNLFCENQNGHMKVELALPAEEYTVFADKGHLIRVFNNLVKNAIQAIPEDRNGRIGISLETKGKGTLVARVSDNGIGISPKMQPKVFFPNFTTKNSGMGLGLAISKNIIDSINGKIYFRTRQGVGTDFYVELPVHSAAPVEA